MNAPSLLLEIAMGMGLAACAGLRAFLPLFLTGLAGRFGWVPLAGPFQWLSSGPALVILGVAVVTEVLADKVPVLDHFLDLMQTIVRPAAGAVLVAAVLTDLTPMQAGILAILAGGSTAAVVHVTKAKLRLISLATTVGFASPVISVLEDVATLAGTVVAIVVPMLMLLFVAVALIVTILAIRRFRVRAARFQSRP
jgi:hypothetical protein